MAKQIVRLYVLGYTPIAQRAIENLKLLCQQPEFSTVYDTEVINLLDQPSLAEEEKILATPVLIKKLPEPMRRIIGDLSDRERVLVGLDIFTKDSDIRE
ncbi:MAG: circadian clock protein KaiB [gamma proteobacterium symbiont of Ctena orbiculata]|nr:circadian clock protein KaiB [Candidatus Thiodiazotropha taylori]MBT3060475.1 circadian clock protein KaiB [Candidatus Thiodiazotropha sp. (ex Lucina pensylvanica)]MBV2093582.1 circadian clock protein KaiB [Candidatus Thiodiazotropha sp. (ex Codakia orbicularis)]PUB77255.1 MAG: circadian clock protein KaiB [gamma proteobacterium symbiont of Ctena orbiculata]MBT3064697.1 circadian clock protein KaiB [Candidatus Thiodiazotropha sp. (ex Lucina pensylvanica)]